MYYDVYLKKAASFHWPYMCSFFINLRGSYIVIKKYDFSTEIFNAFYWLKADKNK